MNDGGDCCNKEIGPGNKERITIYKEIIEQYRKDKVEVKN